MSEEAEKDNKAEAPKQEKLPKSTDEPPEESPAEEDSNRRSATTVMMLIVGGMIAVCIVLALIAFGIGLLGGTWEDAASFTALIRDLFVILLVLEGIVIGIALVVMIWQLSLLLNVLQNEIKPVVDSAQQAADTMRGTAKFMSEQVTQPVIRSRSAAAGTFTFVREMWRLRRAIKSKPSAVSVEDATPEKNEDAEQKPLSKSETEKSDVQKKQD